MICDAKLKQERIKCVVEHANEKLNNKGRIMFKQNITVHEKSISEVLRNIDSKTNSEGHMQNKNREKCEYADTDARYSFSGSVESLIKYAVRLNACAKRIKLINKSDKCT